MLYEVITPVLIWWYTRGLESGDEARQWNAAARLAHLGPESRQRALRWYAHSLNDLELLKHIRPAELLDLLVLTGWYHAICFVARAVRLPGEKGCPTFASVAAPARG